MSICLSTNFQFFFGIYIHLGVELLNHVVILYLIFWRNHIKLFSKAVTAFYIPTSNGQEFQFLQSPSNTCFQFLEYGYPSGCEVVSPCDFHWHFPPPHPTSLFSKRRGAIWSSWLLWLLRSSLMAKKLEASIGREVCWYTSSWILNQCKLCGRPFGNIPHWNYRCTPPVTQQFQD